MKLDINDIIIEPIVTEKASEMAKNNKYIFKVNKLADKKSISYAIEKLYNVKVAKCNIINLKGRFKRFRRNYLYEHGYKKAIVTLSEGKLNFFEVLQ
ncbi:MAG TPA: 50S ribosomal protein L23 [Spirochaetota bacterium]|nr:50S ribosomal protein L23 [Spirochaetota bacterium]HOM37916.1 50S ribosomal protein L23 [Spirochaetota bacterium]HPQ48720.1 50S ribosomal protein L23 [Spirochaetota bacterium]